MSDPLKNPRHEAFAQSLALNKTFAEAYRLAGYGAADPNAKGSRLAANGDISARVAALKSETNRESKLTKERAMELLATIAENTQEKASDRIAAMKTTGAWCGWETGTEAENRMAGATESLCDSVARIRAQRRGVAE